MATGDPSTSLQRSLSLKVTKALQAPREIPVLLFFLFLTVSSLRVAPRATPSCPIQSYALITCLAWREFLWRCSTGTSEQQLLSADTRRECSVPGFPLSHWKSGAVRDGSQPEETPRVLSYLPLPVGKAQTRGRQIVSVLVESELSLQMQLLPWPCSHRALCSGAISKRSSEPTPSKMLPE